MNISASPAHDSRLLHPLYLVLAVAGVVIALLLTGETFPAATIDLTVGRQEAEERALAFLAERGVTPDGRWRAVSFATDRAQDYLTAAVGLEGLQALSEQDLNLARWRVRLFTPLDPEEWSVEVSSRTGRIVGFRHTLREEAPGASLDYFAARERALAALPGSLVPDLRLVGYTRTERPARADHRFVWEQPALQRGEATYRYAVTVQGDAAGAREEYYQLPASWDRQASWHLRRGVLLSWVGWTLTMGLAAGLGLAWLWAAGRGILRLRFAAITLASCAVVSLLTGLNSLPLLLRSYPVEASPAAYLFQQLGGYAGALVAVAGTVVLGGMAGEALLWRRSGGRLSLSRALTPAGLVSRPVVRGLLVGICVGAAQLGYVTLFYWAGRRWLGVWYPVFPEYNDLLTTPLPWLYALATGLLPAAGEELLFRLGGITLIRRATGMRNLAVAVTAVVWASLHATYSQQPFYIRVLELSVVGVIFGVLFLRYGIMASVAAHYTYNAAVTLPLILAGDWAARAGGALAVGAMALLLIPALARRVRGGALLGEETLADPLPSDAPARGSPGADEGETSENRGAPLAVSRTRGLLVAALGAAVLLLALAVLPAPPALDRPLTRAEAVAASVEAAAGVGQPTDGLFGGAWPVDGLVNVDARYLAEHPGAEDPESAIGRLGLRSSWYVRLSGWDRDDPLVVWLDAEGRLLAMQRTLPDDAPGATLPEAEARGLAESLLRRQGIEPAEWRLVDTAVITRPQRLDHTFTWELAQPLGEAGWPRVTVGVQGERVGLLAPHHFTPPEYRREREQRTLVSSLASAIPALPAGAGLLLSGAALLLALRRPERVRDALAPMVAVGLAGGLALLGTDLLRMSAADLAEPPRLIQTLSGNAYFAILAAGQLALAYLAAHLAREGPGSRRTGEQTPARWAASPWTALVALPALLAIEALVLGLTSLPGAVRSPAGLGAWLPGAALLLRSGYEALQAAVLLSGTALLIGLFRPLRPLAWPLVTLGAALAAVAPELPRDWLALPPAWGLALLAAWALRGNLVALALALWLAAALPDALLLLGMSRPWYVWHGALALAALVVATALSHLRPRRLPRLLQLAR
jgi:hypothetical protein